MTAPACPKCGNLGPESGLCGECLRELADSRPLCGICEQPILSDAEMTQCAGECVHVECYAEAMDQAYECHRDADYEFERARGER